MISEKASLNYCKNLAAIENYQKAVESEEFYEIHHRLEDLGFSKKDLIYLGLYYNVPPEELVFMSKSEHMSHHNKGDKNPYNKVSHLYKGENNPAYGRTWVYKGDERLYIDKNELNTYLSKGYIHGLKANFNDRSGANNNQFGKTGIDSAYYLHYMVKGEIPPAVLKSMESKWNWRPFYKNFAHLYPDSVY